MAVNEQDILEFDEMFDLTSDKNDDESNEQAEEYGHSSESDESFNQLAKEVSDKIEDSENKGVSIDSEYPQDIIDSVCSDEVCEVPQPEKKEEIKVKCSSCEDTGKPCDSCGEFHPKTVMCPPHEVRFKGKDSINAPCPVCGLRQEGQEVKPTLPGIGYACDNCGVPWAEHNYSCGDSKSILVKDVIKDDKIQWMLDSPSDMYNSLYIKKNELLNKYMVGGQVEYTRWINELAEASVDIRGEIFDRKLIIHQMEAVQQNRERVKYIHIRVNNQYYMFKRYIEMMRGFLARIEYLKPVLKQEGLIMEHMRDIELYYARLEALHDSALKTEKTLAAAFETLSRKATICMELKPAERVDMEEASQRKQESERYVRQPQQRRMEAMDEFDDLPADATAAPRDHKVGEIKWNEI